MMVKRFVSDPLELPPALGEFSRADLIFYGVDHSGASFEAMVYLDNPNANARTGRTGKGYVGSFVVFGHGGCFGDVGHCDVPTGPREAFDLRPPHQLTPQVKVVDVTERVRGLLTEGAETVSVTVVAHPEGATRKALLSFESARLVSYK